MMADLPGKVPVEQVDFVRVEQADDGSWKWVAFDYQARPVAERRDFRKLHKARTSAKVVFPGKQVLRPGCRVCKAPLWGEKTRFCSRDCAQRLANWKRPQKVAVSKFLSAVEDPMWLERPAQKPVSAADGVHFVNRIDPVRPRQERPHHRLGQPSRGR
jgi:hypothetical protein